MRVVSVVSLVLLLACTTARQPAPPDAPPDSPPRPVCQRFFASCEDRWVLWHCDGTAEPTCPNGSLSCRTDGTGTFCCQPCVM